MDGMLSQDEINALLNGVATEDAGSSSSSVDDTELLSPDEKDAVGEISNISMGTAATTLSSLLNQKVNITTPQVSYATWDELSDDYDRPCVLMHISYIEGLDGNNVLVLKENDVKIITDLMMGGAGIASDEPLGELHLSAIGEAMNQMMGSAATSMSSMLNRKIDISPPIANLVDLNSGEDAGKMPQFLRTTFVKVAFKMQIGDLIDSEIMQLYPIDFAKELYTMFAVDASAAPTPAPQPAAAAEPAPQPAPAPAAPQPAPMPDMSQAQQPMMGYPQMGYPQMQQPMMGYPMQPMMGYPPMQQDVNVAPAAFQPFNPDLAAVTQKENINLIMDVPLEVTVELGRTTKSISDILEFSPGTIVELNKIAGEPVDVLVNGKYVAKGEVVVIEESFGIRITEIIK